MQIPPPSVWESWPTPNYIDPPTRGDANYIINLVLFPLALVFVLLRIYTRLVISKSFGLDDVFILAALIPTMAFFALAVMIDIYWDLFRHVWDIPPAELAAELQINLAAQSIFALAFTLTKLSVLQLVRRILERSTGKGRIIILVTMVLVLLEGLVFIFTTIFQCSPVSAYWTLSLTPQNCVNDQIRLLVAGVINTFTDLLVVLLPIFLIWNLNLPLRQNVLVSILFALGFVVVIAGAFRTVMFYRVVGVYDQTWAAYNVWLPSEIELYTGVICASIPPVQPLFMKLFPGAFSYIYPPSPSSAMFNTHRSPSDSSSTRKPRFPKPARPDSQITIEDEVLISYESRLSKQLTRQENKSHDTVDLESGMIKPKKARRWGQKDPMTHRSASAGLFRPGLNDWIGLDSQRASRRHTISQRVQYLKSPLPSPKTVRIDTNDPRIRTITPDSHWDRISGSDGGRESLRSVSAPVSSTKQLDNTGHENGRKNFSIGEMERKTESIASRDSNGTSGSESQIAGFQAAIQAFPLPVSKRISNFNIPSLRSPSSNENLGNPFFQSDIRDFSADPRPNSLQSMSSRVDALREQLGCTPRIFGYNFFIDRSILRNRSSDASSDVSSLAVHVAGLLDGNGARGESGSGREGSFKSRDTVESIRSSEVPSLSALQRLQSMSVSSEASGTGAVGSPLGVHMFRNQPRVDSPTLRMDAKPASQTISSSAFL